MSAKLDRLTRPVVEAATAALWAQWRTLSPMVAGKGRAARALIDPEALVLGSLALGDRERRLELMAGAWAHLGSGLLSVQRMKNLLPEYPKAVADRAATFARTALEQGDGRWRSLARGTGELHVRDKDLRAHLSSHEPAALMLRLRLGLGVGIKADVLAYLLGSSGAHQTVPAIAVATGYYQRAVRRAVEDLAAGGFVNAAVTSPASYRIERGAWRELLGLGEDPPTWRPWSVWFAFVSQLQDWAERQAAGPTVSDYVLSSRARDFLDGQRPKLGGSIGLPDARGYVGERYLEVFEKSLLEVADWLKGCA
jgi:hypothetical protein